MTLEFKDRVLETTTTTGTGTLTLAGAITGYQAFSVIGNGNTCFYSIWAVNASGVPTGQWETGIGTYSSSGTTLARTTVLESSNSGSAVNFSAGTKRVACGVIASRFASIQTKLDGIEANADVTDAANVAAAGAFMASNVIDEDDMVSNLNTKVPTQQSVKAYVDALAATVPSGLGTMSTQDANAVAITGGSINGTVIGDTTPDVGTFTTVYAAGVSDAVSVIKDTIAFLVSGSPKASLVLGGSDFYLICDASVTDLRFEVETAHFTGNLNVGGNLTVTGDTITVNTATLTVEDPLIKLASGNSTTDIVDIGFYGLCDPSGSQDTYAGLVRDASDGVWKLFELLQTEPTTTVNFSGTGLTYADLQVARLQGSSLQISSASGDSNTINGGGTYPALVIDSTTSASVYILELKYNGSSVAAVNGLGKAIFAAVNGLTITTTTGTLTIVNGGSLITAGAYATTLTSTAATNVTLPTTGTLATLAGSETFTNKTLTAPVLSGVKYATVNQYDAGNSGTAITINFATNGNRQKVAMTGNCTFTFTAPASDAVLYLKLTQDATGSRTATWPSSVKWPAGTAPTLSTAANSVDIVTLVYDATAGHYYAQCAKGFA